jgi:hypothetical protein
MSDVLLMFAEAENEINNGPNRCCKDCIRTSETKGLTVETLL